jgi:hypothetical protein
MRTMTDGRETMTVDRDGPAALDLPAASSVEVRPPAPGGTGGRGRGRRAGAAGALALWALLAGCIPPGPARRRPRPPRRPLRRR